MLTLEVDENRYVVRAEGIARVRMARFPGAVQQAGMWWQLPRHPGVILALDLAFGPENWTPIGDADFDAEEARERTYDPPAEEAWVTLDQNRLAVECFIGDRELVKLVPGYRWSPSDKLWYVAAQPLALDILLRHYGERLHVHPEAQAYIETRRGELEQALERWQVREAAAAEEAAQRAAAPSEAASTPEHLDQSGEVAEDRVLAAIAELRADVLRLEERLSALSLTPHGVANEAVPQEPEAQSEDEADATGSIEHLLELAREDPAEALAQAGRLLQTMEGGGDEAALRCIAGVAAERMGQHENAFDYLSSVLAGLPLADGNLWQTCIEAYGRVVLALIARTCGPAETIACTSDLVRLLFSELATDSGFDDACVGSTASRDLLDLLVNDRALRNVLPELSDACRITHLLSSTRSGTKLAVTRVAAVLREGSLTPETSALAMILYANVCAEAKAMSDWMRSWPASEEEAPVKDGAWLVALALKQLPDLEEHALTGKAALAVLGAIAPGPAEQATLQQRRTLARYVPEGPDREEAEFLAAYRLAAKGEPINLNQLPGYLERISLSHLETSAAHLAEVYMAQSTGSVVKALADGPYLRALKTWGITDPVPQVLELLDLLAEGSNPDNGLNELGELIEDEILDGADRFSRAQRKQVYERALSESNRMGRDRDTRTAFERLVRELRNEGAHEELRRLCVTHQQNKHLRVASLVVQLELALEHSQPFEEVLEQLANSAQGRAQHGAEEVVPELRGLLELYPQLNEPLQKMLKDRGLEPTANEGERPSIEGRSVLLVGGHRWLEQQAKQVFEGWGVKAKWLDPHSAKNGSHALDLASGARDLVVINTRCIGHAASGRVDDAAKAAGNPVFYQNSHGVGGLLESTRLELEKLAMAAEETKRAKAKERRALIR